MIYFGCKPLSIQRLKPPGFPRPRVNSCMRYWIIQVTRASSRLLNALTGGEGDCTFSAWSYHLAHDRQRKWGKFRVRVIDGMFGTDHCKNSYLWHRSRDLLHIDDLSI